MSSTGALEKPAGPPTWLIEALRQEIALSLSKWNVTEVSFFIDNEDHGNNHGLSLYFGSGKPTNFTRNMNARQEENISLEESLGDFGI